MGLGRFVRQIFGIVFRPLGTLNKDKDFRYLTNGDVTESFNTRTTTEGGNLGNTRQVILGNTYSYQPDPIQLQNKKFRIEISSAQNGTYAVAFNDGNGLPVGSLCSVVVVLGNISQTLQDFAYSGVDSIQNVLTLASQTFTLSTVVTGTNEGYVEVEVTTVPYWEYTCTNALFNFVTLIATIITVQEAIDQSLIGDWRLIGSYDLLGELIEWRTTQTHLPENITIISITNNGSLTPLWRVQTNTPHNQQSFSKVVLRGCGIADGQWIIQVVSATEFDLLGTPQPFVLPVLSSNPFVTVYPNGIGEVDRSVRDEQAQTWTSFRLIRAKALNLVTEHKVDTLCKKDALRKYYRFTDDYNPIRNLYDRTLVYQNDCLLSFVDPRNTYSYENIGQESLFIQSGADYGFRFTSQDQSGGQILSGNSRFAVRLLTDSLVPTAWSLLTNPVPASKSSESGSATNWSGDAPNIITPKINNFSLRGNLVDNYKWAQIAVINYQGDSVIGLLLPKVLITSDSMTLRWTGSEAAEDLDVGTVQQITFGYRTALSIDELNGQIIFSNLTGNQTYDLSGFAQSFTHSILREEIPAIGSRYNGNLIIGEYEKSATVNTLAGYMINETERFGLQAEFHDGSQSLIYHIQDIKISTEGNTYPRRIAGLPDEHLTNSNGTLVYVPYVQFSGINWDYILPSGQKVRDVVRKLKIFKVFLDDTLREVWSGVGIQAVTANGFAPFDYTFDAVSIPAPSELNITADGASQIMEYPFAGGMRLDPTYLNEPYSSFRFGTAGARSFLSLYIPDLMYGGSSLDINTTDVIRDYGEQNTYSPFPAAIGYSLGDLIMYNSMTEYTGFRPFPFDDLSIADATYIDYGATGNLSGTTFAKRAKFFAFSAVPAYAATAYMCNPSSPVVNLTTSFAPFSSPRGTRRISVIRTKNDKFSDPLTSKYVSTGAEVFSSDTTVNVFGGQVMTQKTWMPHMIIESLSGMSFWESFGLCTGIGFYSQNYVNTDQTNRVDSSMAWAYPRVSEEVWLNDGAHSSEPTLAYNQGYNLFNKIQSYTAYNIDQSLIAGDFPVRLIYGQKAQPEQASDTQRIFLPLDFTDLQYKDGEIVHHRVVNSELCAWQANYFSRLYFHSNRLVTTTSGAEVITGTGDAFSNRPLNITSYGCPNKWLILKGRSAGGNDVMYWINPILRSFIRFGGDGTTNQGLIHGLDSFFRFYTMLIKEKDGTCVWDETFKEAIFTVRSYRDDIPEYAVGKYNEGDLVSFGTVGFEEFPQFYISLVNNNFTSPPSSSWQAIDITNSSYYNIYTFAFSEIKNGFEYFASFHPRIYSQYKNTFLSEHPLNSKMYEHDKGAYAVFYDTQQEGWYYEGVININPDEIKSYYGIRVRTLSPPERIDFTTQQQISYLNAADFEYREDNYNAGVRMDATVTTSASPDGSEANPAGLADIDTSRLYGDYLKVKQSGISGVAQSIFNFIVRVRMRVRSKDT